MLSVKPLHICGCSAHGAVAEDFKGGRSSANSGWQMAAYWNCQTPFAHPRALQISRPAPNQTALLSGTQLTGPRLVLHEVLIQSGWNWNLFYAADRRLFVIISPHFITICHPVLSDLWEWHSETADSLQETGRRWAVPDYGPRELFLDYTADQNPTMLPQAVWR